MRCWETAASGADRLPVVKGYAEIGRAADKIVYSKTLATAASARTRIARDFDPGAIRQIKARGGRDISVGGTDLAAQAIRAGLVDEFHLFLVPIVVGGGKPSLPSNFRVNPDILDERRFGSGVFRLNYRAAASCRYIQITTRYADGGWGGKEPCR